MDIAAVLDPPLHTVFHFIFNKELLKNILGNDGMNVAGNYTQCLQCQQRHHEIFILDKNKFNWQQSDAYNSKKGNEKANDTFTMSHFSQADSSSYSQLAIDNFQLPVRLKLYKTW